LKHYVRLLNVTVVLLDGTFRGNCATTHDEFAAGLNACLQQVESLIASAKMEFLRREDLETL
jgi:hypothetical protein